MKVNINKLTKFEKEVYYILRNRYREHARGVSDTKGVTRQELAMRLNTHDSLIRGAISSMRQKGVNVGPVAPCGYGLLSAKEMRGNRAYLISYIKDLVSGVRGIDLCIGIPDGQISLEEVLNG